MDETWDGKFHEIKVKVNRSGVKVQAQKGYFNPKVFAKFTKLEKRLHLVDLARNSSPQFALPKKIDSFCGIWTDNMALNLSEIVPGDLEDIFADKAEFFLLIYDLEGELVAEGTKDLDFREDPPERVSTYAFSRLPPGRYDCITVLRNKRTGAAAGQVPFMSAQLKSKTEEHSYTLNVSQRPKSPSLQDSRLVFEIVLVPVPAGDYVLEVSLAGSDPADSRIYSQDVSIR